jgi:hypothetical protein
MRTPLAWADRSIFAATKAEATTHHFRSHWRIPSSGSLASSGSGSHRLVGCGQETPKKLTNRPLACILRVAVVEYRIAFDDLPADRKDIAAPLAHRDRYMGLAQRELSELAG